ncbi:MAG: hypothetical protein GWM98_04660 [Nitrospinaceae bacterium]|nr:hypothetical protein [Nitrospinaceae bacterium]
MLSNTMIRLNDSVLTYVREAEQTLVAELKKARAEDSPGGVLLTDNEARNVKKMVIDNVRRMWGEKGIEDLKKVLGVDDAGLQKYLEAKIEESVLTEKRSSLPPAPPEEKEEGDG